MNRKKTTINNYIFRKCEAAAESRGVGSVKDAVHKLKRLLLRAFKTPDRNIQKKNSECINMQKYKFLLHFWDGQFQHRKSIDMCYD